MFNFEKPVQMLKIVCEKGKRNFGFVKIRNKKKSYRKGGNHVSWVQCEAIEREVTMYDEFESGCVCFNWS